MPVLTDIATLATCPVDGRHDDAGLIPDAALAWEGDSVAWVGPSHALPREYAGWQRESAAGRLVVPGLIDCHTHLAFGGDRAGEFVERLQGTSYEAIAARGGGILVTMQATRASTADELATGGRRTLRRTSTRASVHEARSGVRRR